MVKKVTQKNFIIREIQKKPGLPFLLSFPTDFFRQYGFSFFHRICNRIVETIEGVRKSNIVNYAPENGTLIFWNFQNTLQL